MSDSVRPHRWHPTRLPCPWDSPVKNTGVGCHFLLQCMKVKSESEVAQSCPTLRDPMDCSLSGSSVHGIFQARLLEWGAIAFSACYAYGQLNPVSSSWSLVRAELKSHCVLSVLDFAVSLLPFILLALQLRCLCVCSSGLAQESGAPGSSCICFFVVQVMHSVINYLLCL